MKTAASILLLILILSPGSARAQDRYDPEALAARKPEPTPDLIEAGRVVYGERCAFCHGDKGDGLGAIADYLDPRPRDFTSALFKFRTTQSGELPTDEDLYRVISRGVPGTAMPAWGEGEFKLSEDERWEVLFHLKTFVPDFEDPDFDPYQFIVASGDPPTPTPEIIAKGKTFFEDTAKGGCVRCHGLEGRGDGSEAAGLEDDLGFPVLPANLHKGWRLKNGPEARDAFRTLTTGLNGTPMPGYAESLEEEDLWAIAHYVKSLVEEKKVGASAVLTAGRVEGELPTDPDDPAWSEPEPLVVFLTGQVVVAPRWQNLSVDQLKVWALYNDRDIALRLVWDDRFKDIEHQDPPPEAPDTTYVPANTRPEGPLRDALAVQFPVKRSEGPQKPYLLLGQPRMPVNIWEWRADWQEAIDENGGRTVLEQVGQGWRKPIVVQPDTSQAVVSWATFDNGQWRLVMRRPLVTDDPKADVQLGSGVRTSVAFRAWDGSNGEYGLRSSMSSWYDLQLEAPIPMAAYVWGLIAAALALALEMFLVRRARRAVGAAEPVEMAETGGL